MNFIVLSSGGKSTEKIVEAGQSKGHVMKVVDPLDCSLILSESPLGYDSILHGEEKLKAKEIDCIISRNGAGSEFGTVVLRHFHLMGIPSTNEWQSIMVAKDKFFTGQMLSDSGIRQVKTIFAKRPEKIKTLIDKLGGLPVVVKILDGSQGKGVFILETPLSANTALESLYSREDDLVLQKYMGDTKDIRAWVIDGKYICAMERLKVRNDFRKNASIGAEAVKIKLTDSEKEMAVKAAKACGLGVAGVDILRGKEHSYVLEVNSSPSLKKISEVHPSINLAANIVEYAEKLVNDKKDKSKSNERQKQNSSSSKENPLSELSQSFLWVEYELGNITYEQYETEMRRRGEFQHNLNHDRFN